MSQLLLEEEILKRTQPKFVTRDPEDADDVTDAKSAAPGPLTDELLVPESSTIRKNAQLLEDKKYSGKKVSRKDLDSSDDDSQEEGSSDLDSAGESPSENVPDVDELLKKLKETPQTQSYSDSELNDSDDADSDDADSDDADSDDADSDDADSDDADSDDVSDDVDNDDADGDNVDSDVDSSDINDELIDYATTLKQNGGQGSDDEEKSSIDDEDSSWEEENQGDDLSNDSMQYDDMDRDVSEVEDDDQEEAEGIQRFTKTNISAEAAKALDLKNQKNIWDGEIGARIKLQKAIALNNILPQCDDFSEFKAHGNPRFPQKCKEVELSTKLCLDQLVQLSADVYRQNPQTKYLNKNDVQAARKQNVDDDDEEITSDSELSEEEEQLSRLSKKIKLEQYPKYLEKMFQDITTYRNATLQKWYEQTKLTSTTDKKFSSFSQSTVEQINHVLQNHDRLVKRTQLKRSTYRSLGKPETLLQDDDDEESLAAAADYDKEIFDDEDFYHDMLKSIIAAKAANITDPIEMSRLALQAQRLRKRAKKNVDTRASKGRKIRYHVHTKAKAFMAPDQNRIIMDDDASDGIMKCVPQLMGTTKKTPTTENSTQRL